MAEMFFAPLVARMSAIKKAAYRLASVCDVDIQPGADGVTCTLRQIGGDDGLDIEAVFRSTVLDYELREEIIAKTAPFRDALLALTFAPLAKPEP